MGDCAIIVFHSPKSQAVSPAVYLHHHGSCVVALVATALPTLRSGDASYSCARFIGHCHQHIPGVTGLGVYNIRPTNFSGGANNSYAQLLEAARTFDYGERGIFFVDVDAWTITHAGRSSGAYGDYGDGFDGQEQTELHSSHGTVTLPQGVAPVN
jgi:hypothetical protein